MISLSPRSRERLYGNDPAERHVLSPFLKRLPIKRRFTPLRDRLRAGAVGYKWRLPIPCEAQRVYFASVDDIKFQSVWGRTRTEAEAQMRAEFLSSRQAAEHRK